MNRILQQFITIAELKSITKASQQLFIGSSALSKNMKSLQHQINVKLFERTSQGLFLTKEGETFYKHVKIMFLEYNYALYKIKQNQNIVLKIGSGYDWDSEILPHTMKNIKQKYPQISFKVTNGIALNMQKEIINNKYDIVLGELDRHSYDVYGICIKPLLTVQWIPFAHKDSKLHNIKELKDKDLSNSNINWYHFSPDEINPTKALVKFFINNNIIPPKSYMQSSSFSTVLECASIDEDSCSFLPKACINTIMKYNLKPLNINNKPFTYVSGLSYRESIADFPPVKEFIREIKQQIPKEFKVKKTI